jgi:hypothetical protein
MKAKLVRVDRILSAFDNPVDPDLVRKYARVSGDRFPAIWGYESIIRKYDIGGYFLNGDEITADLVGEKVWYVTNGHHRSYAAIARGDKLIRAFPEAIASRIRHHCSAMRQLQLRKRIRESKHDYLIQTGWHSSKARRDQPGIFRYPG